MITRIFINLTNHPSSEWSEKQLQTAKALGEICDMPFPNIPPEASTFDVNRLADGFASDILKKGRPEDIVVHVMGEHSFTYAMVSRLKSHNIKCVLSTTAHATQMLPNGNKLSRFHFIQFREY